MWNFCKYVVAPDGVTVHKFGPEKDPRHLAPKIKELIANSSAEE
jgi:glutathione peroxidase-family protein